MEYERWIKMAQNLSFTTFLIVCVGIMSYGIVELYSDNRAGYERVEASVKTIEQLNVNFDRLIERLDRLLIGGRVVCISATPNPQVSAPTPSISVGKPQE